MKAYPNNTIGAFTVQLAHELDLITVKWEVAICEFSCSPPSVGTVKSHVFVGYTNASFYCDLISPKLVNHLKVRCLRTFSHPTAFCNLVFENLYYISVEKRTFREITIHIFYTAGIPIAFKSSKTHAKVVLHFRSVLQ